MRRRTISLFAPAVLFGLIASPSLARQNTDPCLMQSVAIDQGDPYDPGNGVFPTQGWGGNSCTSNDISIKQVVIGAILDGCTNTSDTAQVIMDLEVEASGAGGSRYDIGTWLNVNGGSALTEIDQCVVDIYDPSVPEGADLEGPNDTDACNDAPAGSIVLTSIGPVTLNCADNILPTDGVVDFSGCVGWDQNRGRQCDGALAFPNAVRPSNSSKCGCSDQTVPGLNLPQVTIEKTCSPGSIGLNQVATCTVTITNASTLAPADYMGFLDEWDPTELVVSSDGMGPRTWVDGVRADANTSVVVNNGAGSLIWKPGGDPVMPGNIPVAPSAMTPFTTVLTYEVQIADPDNPPMDAMDNTVCIWQFDRPAPAMDELQQTGDDPPIPFCATASINFVPSAAVITGFEATPTGDGNRVDWETGAEIGTLALQLERWSPAEGFVPVGEPIDTLLQAPQGATYSVIDPGADADALYRIVEIETDGIERIHDLTETPRRVARRSRSTSRAATAEHPVRAARQPHQPPRRFVAVSANKGKPSPTGTGADRAVIEVATSGIQAVSAAELASVFGLQANAVRSSLRTGGFRLHREGNEFNWWTDQGASALYFHGTAFDNIHSRVTAYRLDLGNGTSPRTAQAGSSSGAVTSTWHEERFEENLLANVGIVQNPEVDFWFWAVAGKAGTTTLSFDLDQAEVGSEAELDFDFYGYRVAPGGTLTARLNGHTIGTVPINASGVDRVTFYAPPGILQPGVNTATFTSDANVLGIGADALTVRYERTLEAADGLDFSLDSPTVVRLGGVSSNATLIALDESGNTKTLYRGLDFRSGGVEVALPSGRFVVADAFATPHVRTFEGNLVPQTQAADLVIVAHPSLLDGARAFAEYRSQQGLDVVVKTTTELFDQYGNSEFGPDAIRLFARETYEASNRKLQALFLIGSGTFDDRSLMGFDRSLVPTKLRGVSWGILSSDRWFVDFDEDGADEVAVGRLPASSNDEVLAYLGRVQAYEAGGSWTQQDVLLADNADGAGNFPADSDLLVPILRNPEKIYLGQTHTLAAARAALLDAWSDGRRLINYYGHGGLSAAAHEGLLSAADLSSIGGVASNPLFLGITCNIARFDLPNFPSLGEQMVLAEDGAVAVWAAAGLSTHRAVAGLSGTVVDALDDFGGQRLGEAVRKVTAAAGAAARESGLTLLGDPMIRVP